MKSAIKVRKFSIVFGTCIENERPKQFRIDNFNFTLNLKRLIFSENFYFHSKAFSPPEINCPQLPESKQLISIFYIPQILINFNINVYTPPPPHICNIGFKKRKKEENSFSAGLYLIMDEKKYLLSPCHHRIFARCHHIFVPCETLIRFRNS